MYFEAAQQEAGVSSQEGDAGELSHCAAITATLCFNNPKAKSSRGAPLTLCPRAPAVLRRKLFPGDFKCK